MSRELLPGIRELLPGVSSLSWHSLRSPPAGRRFPSAALPLVSFKACWQATYVVEKRCADLRHAMLGLVLTGPQDASLWPQGLASAKTAEATSHRCYGDSSA